MYTANVGKFCNDSGASTPLQPDDAFRVSPQMTAPEDLIKMGLMDNYANPANILHGSMQLPSMDTPKGLSEMSDFCYPQMYPNVMPLQSYPLFADSYPSNAVESNEYGENPQYNCNASGSMIVPYQLFNDGNCGDAMKAYGKHNYAHDDSFLYTHPGVHFQDEQMHMPSGQRPKSSRSYNRRRHSVSHTGDLEDSDSNRHLTSEKKRRAAINQLYAILEAKAGMMIEGKSSKAKVLHAAASLMGYYKQKLIENNVPY